MTGFYGKSILSLGCTTLGKDNVVVLLRAGILEGQRLYYKFKM